MTQTPTLTQTPTSTDLSTVTTYTISGCTNSNELVVDLGPGFIVPGDTFYYTFTGATDSGCYSVVGKTVAPIDDAFVLAYSYADCNDCVSSQVTPTPTTSETPTPTPTPYTNGRLANISSSGLDITYFGTSISIYNPIITYPIVGGQSYNFQTVVGWTTSDFVVIAFTGGTSSYLNIYKNSVLEYSTGTTSPDSFTYYFTFSGDVTDFLYFEISDAPPPTQTPTQTSTSSETPTPTPSVTNTQTPTTTETQTPTPTPTSGETSVFNITLLEVGSDVVMSGSGLMNLTDLTSIGSTYQISGVAPAAARFVCGNTGPGPSANSDRYTGSTLSSPANFGTFGQTSATSSTGDVFGISFSGFGNAVTVPIGYTSGFLSGTSTYVGKTFATLGITPGTYTYSWGSGPNASSIILQIGV